MKRPLLLLLLTLTLPNFIVTQDTQAEHPIVILISPPRSCSTAFLRMMHARGDFVCLHEHMTVVYGLSHHYDIVKDWYRKEMNIPQSYADITKTITTAAEKSPVFAKEMTIPVDEFLQQQPDFLTKKNVFFIFLVRNPHHSIVSFYKGHDEKIFGEFPTWISTKSTHALFEKIKTTGYNQPLIVCAEDLYTNPEQTAKGVCKYLSLSFVPSMINWRKLSNDFTGAQDWHELKVKDVNNHWHSKAIESTQFTKPTQYAVDTQGQPTFEEVTNLEDKETCKKIYEESMKYYNLLLAEKDSLLTIQ